MAAPVPASDAALPPSSDCKDLLLLDVSRSAAFDRALDVVARFEAESSFTVSLVLMGVVHYGRCEFPEAGACFRDALLALGSATAASAMQLCNRSACHFAMGGPASYAAAIADAQRAIALVPSMPQGHLRLGLALRALKRFPEAGVALERSWALTDDRDGELQQYIKAAIAELGSLCMYQGGVAAVEGPVVAASTSLGSASAAESLQPTLSASAAIEQARCAALEEWLLTDASRDDATCAAIGSAFPRLLMEAYGEDNRGVHCRCDVPPETEVLRIGREFLITVETAREAPLCRKLAAADIDRELSASKHCYLALFVLWDRRNPRSFFQPYYRILPTAYPNIPIFWSEEEVRGVLAPPARSCSFALPKGLSSSSTPSPPECSSGT